MFGVLSRNVLYALAFFSLIAVAGCERGRAPRAADGAVSGDAAAARLANDQEPMSGTEDQTMPQYADGDLQTATFGAGCFWGVEALFRQVDGVVDAAAGYSGGTFEKPTYQDVCTDKTGHAEAVRIRFDPRRVSYEKLLDVFWKCHDPTQVNCQGPDVGTQYRSVIFYHTPEQKAAAEASKKALDESHKYRRPIATEIVPAGEFYRAEEYHQQYLAKHGLANCHLPDHD
jgi:peptide-methionine (S)-S-oxide reductase